MTGGAGEAVFVVGAGADGASGVVVVTTSTSGDFTPDQNVA